MSESPLTLQGLPPVLADLVRFYCRFKIKLFTMFKPGDEKYNNLSLLFNCLNGILFASLFLHIFAIERMKSDIIIR